MAVAAAALFTLMLGNLILTFLLHRRHRATPQNVLKKSNPTAFYRETDLQDVSGSTLKKQLPNAH